MLGPLDWIPGTVQLFVFIIQLAIVAAIFAHRIGWARSLAYNSAMLLFLILVSAKAGTSARYLVSPLRLVPSHWYCNC